MRWSFYKANYKFIKHNRAEFALVSAMYHFFGFGQCRVSLKYFISILIGGKIAGRWAGFPKLCWCSLLLLLLLFFFLDWLYRETWADVIPSHEACANWAEWNKNQHTRLAMNFAVRTWLFMAQWIQWLTDSNFLHTMLLLLMCRYSLQNRKEKETQQWRHHIDSTINTDLDKRMLNFTSLFLLLWIFTT